MNPFEKGLRYLAGRGLFPLYQSARGQGEMSGWGFATMGHIPPDVSVTLHEAVTQALVGLAEDAREEAPVAQAVPERGGDRREIDALVKELRNQDHIAGWGGGRSRDA
jgi:hypothetical protein